MKIENEKIIQATEDELYSYWLSRGWDDVYSFPEYMQRMKDAGCKVVAEMLQTVFDRITASPEALGKEFVEPYTRWGEDGHLETLWRSNFRELSGMLFDTKEEAIAATVVKLKEVEK